MKIQLDTENKTIKVESDVKLKDLVDTLEKLLPKGEWKEFELQTNVTITGWSAPIIIDRWQQLPRRDYPWYCGTVMKVNLDNDVKLCDHNLKSGTYNIEC